jgi:hypothetical protein
VVLVSIGNGEENERKQLTQSICGGSYKSDMYCQIADNRVFLQTHSG